ncbi:hypothetical protein DDZ14_02600 [Maritimibacter sp. 55A14]|uniref:DUF1127 domain-containing protein n=1 Tax=Maritimibacter sp. 55A14 TaxID=2174844 RepID=UPI000D621F22|nr:DUF1127 domain-containing protein [Maritimibacter sp. 55A14]PWE34071.1 hypothetical protein DDZ14_02600 [Maritimibacter sp. 55A14]
MAVAIQTPLSTHMAELLSDALLHAPRAVGDVIRFRRTRKALAALDNKTLADLGLARSEIDRAAHEAVYGTRL